MPPINRQFDMVHSDEWSMKVAFASSDYRHVDQHFGATPRLVVYGVKADRVTLIRVVDFSVENGHQTEKIARRIHALEDWRHAVLRGDWRRGFSSAFAGSASARTRSRRHHHRRLTAEIQLYWYDKGQRKNTRQRDPERFTRLLQEQEWREEPDPRR